MNALATRLGWTEGQLYTAVVGLVLAVVLGVAGIPSVLGSHAAPAPNPSVSTIPFSGVTR